MCFTDSFENDSSKLNRLYLELNCYTSVFCVGNTQFKDNNGFVILVVQSNYEIQNHDYHYGEIWGVCFHIERISVWAVL